MHIIDFYKASFLLVYVKAGSVDAVPDSCLVSWSVFEDMTEVAVTIAAPHFRPDHAVAHILNLLYIGIFVLVVEGWPTTTAIELEDRVEERVATHNAGIGADFVRVLVFA